MVSRKILIISDDRNGLPEMMCSYLNYYGGGRIRVHIPGLTTVIHPLAEQVLKEDGLEQASFQNENIAEHDMVIYINHSIPKINKGKSIQLSIEDPNQNTSYIKVVEAYRRIREIIKKEAIKIAGELIFV